MRNLFTHHDILFRKSCRDTPEQNEVAERKHLHLLELTRTMLFEAKMPATFWVDAVFTATYIINRLPTPNLNGLSPFENLFHHSLDFSFMRIFGCVCFPNFNATSSNKLSPRSVLCVFLGYPPEYKGYHCLDPLTDKIYINMNVIFHENYFPYSDLTSSKYKNTASVSHAQPPAHIPLVSPSHTHPSAISPSPSPADLLTDPKPFASLYQPPSPVQPNRAATPRPPSPRQPDSPTPSPPSSPNQSDSPSDLPPSPNTSRPHNPSPPTFPNQTGHPMQTRAKSDIFKPKTIFNLKTYIMACDPTCFNFHLLIKMLNGERLWLRSLML
ncbi:unnamed protein product [Cuscuta europaea]|uniref:Retroviral polymerase SH3-like domain-containing protein n=1 Tax=Cuscuta europaea TaxID=41803 RepID=A0A9P1E9L5_CUSEU|nr:unnamed protein product [Cuscuta europaea]